MWVHWLCSKKSLHLHVESQIPGIPACHFRWIVSVNPTDSIYDLINFIFGEAMLKDPEPTSHSEWGVGGGVYDSSYVLVSGSHIGLIWNSAT